MKKELENIAKELQIENILDREASKLSGGEFQNSNCCNSAKS